MKKTDYFDIMQRQTRTSLEAAELLQAILADYDPEKTGEQREKMHLLEHAGDEIRHEAMKKLSRDFITPIEQDDLISLVQILDDVTDAIDEVVIELYMYNIKSLPKETKHLADMMLSCVKALSAAAVEFGNFKKSKTLMELIIDVNTMEGQADDVYIEAVRALFVSEENSMHAFGVKAIYDSLESCCDLCEHAADVMESVIMNNT